MANFDSPSFKRFVNKGLSNFLNTVKITEILESEGQYWKAKRDRKILSIESDKTVREAISMIAKNDILSIPVVDPKDKEFLGFVDMVDVLHAVLGHISEDCDKKNNEYRKFAKWCEDINELEKKNRDLMDHKIGSIINQSKYDNFIPVDENGTMYQLLSEVFSRGIHRVIVYNEHGAPRGLLSQADIIKFMLENLDNLGSVVHERIGNIGIINPNVISMSSKAQAIHAYYLMLFHGVPGVAILNSNEEIIANLSVTDLRGMDPNTFSQLLRNSLDVPKKKVVTCTKDTPLELILLKLYENKIHRIWVVESATSNKCVGVISMSDVMKFFSQRSGNNPQQQKV
ncbi:hypothetical protein SAMD00019534_061290, partial [Acytostelium subglobosum LB1]|uniref:hypothetical protein n=1 Tax=Acytostelium subglobosum LB1 TaxID=1410327 RepID=UPI000644896E